MHAQHMLVLERRALIQTQVGKEAIVLTNGIGVPPVEKALT